MTTRTTAAPDRDINVYAHSPISMVFSRLLGILATAIEAERDIEHAGAWDPAFSAWLRDAELAWEAVGGLLRRIEELPQVRVADVPLVQIARRIHDLLGSETHAEYVCVRHALIGHPELYCCPGSDPVSMRVRAMLRSAQARIDDLCQLEMLTLLADYAEMDGPGMSAAM